MSKKEVSTECNELLERHIEKWNNLYRRHLKAQDRHKVGSVARRNHISLRIMCTLAIHDLTEIKKAL